ncbi:MAG TPA: CbiX/SirB N-terminal domain-containing protein [Xanthomonadales bacterium]
MQRIILVDNGSRRADAVLNLRRLARAMSERSAKTIDAVPLQHADKIPPGALADALGGKRVATFAQYVEEALISGADELVIIPMFFGNSRAITSFIPDTLNAIQATHGKFNWSIADELCPLPQGEPLLARLLLENLQTLVDEKLTGIDCVVLVDHGSPSKEVTDVRVKLAAQLAAYLPEHVPLLQAVMERREGFEYDFNGPLLQDLLAKLARENEVLNVAISMLFLSPGRHAGEGGDIADICGAAMQNHPGLSVRISPLVGENPLLIDLLCDRLQAVL